MAFSINPECEGCWSLTASISKVAVKTQDNRNFIPSFSVGSNYQSRFIAIGIQVNASRSNWKYGGYLGI